MRDGLGHVSVVTFLAVVAMSSRCVVTTVETDTAASPAGQFIQLHVEATASGMQVTVAGWVKSERGTKISHWHFASQR